MNEQIEQPTVTIKDPEGNVVGTQELPTEGQMRKLRRQFVTKVHPRVAGCGHRLDLDRQPRQRNCQTCWFAWFQNHGEICQQLDEMYQAEGKGMIVQLQGKKFLHRWLQFMATIAQWKMVQESQAIADQEARAGE